MQAAAGTLLVASANLTDPAFMRAVVYLLEHDDDGTLGFIINRPLDIPLSELWSECPASLGPCRIAAEGGPVDRNKGLLLHTALDLSGVQAMGLGLAVGGDLDALAKRFAEGADDAGPRLFLGHSQWDPGQLAAEIEEGGWIVRPGRPELVVNAKPSPLLWQHLLEGHGGLPEPSLN